jgi:hypothetical protein
MLRLLIGTGALLMLVGFGAAGWQYWQGIPVAGNGASGAVDPAVSGLASGVWLVTSTGAIVPEAEATAFLVQDRLVPERIVEVTATAALGSLLLAGEKLPAAPYLEVLADIRAPRLAQALCPILTDAIARTCMVVSARVVPGSVDALRSEARFVMALAYRESVDAAALPDLAAHVLRSETVRPDPAAASNGIEAVLTGTVQAAVAACAAEDRAATCRVLGMTVDWTPGTRGRAEARVAWLSPLPEGMFPAPPIAAQPEG